MLGDNDSRSLFIGEKNLDRGFRKMGGVKTALSRELPFRTADNHLPSTFFTPCLHLENPKNPRLTVENLANMYL